MHIYARVVVQWGKRDGERESGRICDERKETKGEGGNDTPRSEDGERRGSGEMEERGRERELRDGLRGEMSDRLIPY